MADLSMIKRGVVSITSADAGTSKDVALPSAVKTGSSFLRYVVRDRRRNALVQRGTIAITDADVGGTKDSAALATAVDTTAAQVIATIREKRTDDFRGATVHLQSSTVVRATFNPPAAGDTIDVDFQVIEHKPRRAATLRLLDEDTLRAEWDLALVAGETIDIEYELIEFDPLADVLLEIDFLQRRTLGELGINQVQDLLTRDDMRNLVQYRVRTFTTKALANAATRNIPDGDPLEEGEMHRRTVTISVDVRTNDRDGLASVLDKLMDTPGITVEE